MAGDSFEDAFDTLIRGEAQPAAQTTPAAQEAQPAAQTTPAAPEAQPAAQTTPAAQEAQPAAQAAEGDPPTEIEGVEGDEPTAQTQPQPEPKPQPQPGNEDALARLADMLAQRQPAQPEPKPQVQSEGPPLYSAEEMNLIRQYHQDYPDVVRAEALVRRQEYAMLTTHIFSQLQQFLAPRLALLEQLADTTAYSQLSQKVPNYDAELEKVVSWVPTQPPYLQAAYNHVIQTGTVEEIADLFNRYRQATGAAAPSPTTVGGQSGTATPTSAQAAELSPAVKQAASRLAPVTSKRSAPAQAAPATFDAAFDEFAKAG